MKSIIVSLMLLAITAAPGFATDSVCSGYSDMTQISAPALEGSSDQLFHHHDNGFENSYSWQLGGSAAPYHGAFGEAYDLGPTTVQTAVFWFTTVSADTFTDQTMDVYVWDGGVSGDPGAVIAVAQDILPTSIGVWPTITQLDIPINASVSGEFTVGFWGNWPGEAAAWLIAADLTGPQGNPWTYLVDGSSYGSGWIDPSVVWGPTNSLGIGVYAGDPTSTEHFTWGEIKALF